MDTEKKRILFLCTGNAARSQMAEALARIDYGDVVEPLSAGSRPAGFVHALAVLAIAELGVSIEEAESKSAEEYSAEKLDLVVTVCDSAAADCPTWPGARHIVNWSIADPSFVRGTEAERLDAFRTTRDELRRRIDGLMEALRRSVPRRTDAELLAEGARILERTMADHGFRFGGVSEEKVGHRVAARGRFSRRGRALDLQVRSGVAIAAYVARERLLLHPDYMAGLGATAAMRYPGLSSDPLDAFRRLRADLIRFARPFLTGRGMREFEKIADAHGVTNGPAKTA
ncbi:MAG TPA: arsenate reductase ArsC [Thermoanaerobaculia bacterium]|nr:arsenate reductase ArsC [Thermoanaerobaculia bacterium]